MGISQELAKEVTARVGRRMAEMVHDFLKSGVNVSMDYVPREAGAGDTVELRSFKGNTVYINLTIHAEAGFFINVAAIQLNPNLLDVYLQPCAIAMFERIEVDTLALVPQFSQSSSIGKVVGDLSLGRGCPFPSMAVNTADYKAIRKLPKFTEVGSEGSIGDLRILRSHFLPVPNSLIAGFGFSREAIAIAIRRLPLPSQDLGVVSCYAEVGPIALRTTICLQEEHSAQQMSVEMLYGVGILDDRLGTKLTK